MAYRYLRTAAVMLRRWSAPKISSHRKTFLPQNVSSIRSSFMDHYIPPDQYSNNSSPLPKFRFPEVLSVYHELYPLFVVTAIAIGGVIFNTIWACFNKVDVVFTTHNRKNISRTMNLCAPTCHKLITINQVYKPWPQMARVLRIMKEEQCARAQRQSCD